MSLAAIVLCLGVVRPAESAYLGACSTGTFDGLIGNSCSLGDVTFSDFDFLDNTGPHTSSNIYVAAGPNTSGDTNWLSFGSDPSTYTWVGTSDVWIRYTATVGNGREFTGVESTVTMSGLWGNAAAAFGVCEGAGFGGTMPALTCGSFAGSWSTSMSFLFSTDSDSGTVSVGSGYSTIGIANRVVLSAFTAVDSFRNNVSSVQVVPEPSMWITLGTGLLGLLALRRRRRRDKL